MTTDIASISLLPWISRLCGWLYTLSWSLSFYPQPLLNLRRRSTAGTTPSFSALNVLGFCSYAASCLSFRYSATIRQQYRDRHEGENSTVQFNDVVFALHALLLSCVTLSQYAPSLWGFDRRGGVRVGRVIWFIIFACCAGVAWVFGLVVLNPSREGQGAVDAASIWQWIDVVYMVGYVKIVVTMVKYVPQAWTNYQRQSTVGWSIEQILMDLFGGILSLVQLFLDSSRQKDWSGVIGNPVKLALGNISTAFDLLFILQHYVLYRHNRGSGKHDPEQIEQIDGQGLCKQDMNQGYSREHDGLLDRGRLDLDTRIYSA